jgi:DNA-binding MarR family transcriptional regulator
LTLNQDFPQDYVDLIISQWQQERPDLDVSGVEVIGRMSRLSRLLERAIELSFGSYDLSITGFYVLAALRRSGPPYRLTPTALYSSLLVSSGAMTNRLDRLENAGLVTRIADPTDGRSRLVALTPEGGRLVDAAIETHAANEIHLLAGLSPRERSELARLLRKLLLIYNDQPGATGRVGAHPVVSVRDPFGGPLFPLRDASDPE